MPLAQSRLTSQGQISVPAGVRKRLGIGPGSAIEWHEEDGKIVVRKAGRYSFEDIHNKLFPEGPPKKKSLKQLREGVKAHIRGKHARG
jgi:AbrB family looped-hinge helix DNA binding protein